MVYVYLWITCLSTYTEHYIICTYVKCVALFSDMTSNVKTTPAIQYVLTLLSDLTEVRMYVYICSMSLF